jgi:hypothetical protein
MFGFHISHLTCNGAIIKEICGCCLALVLESDDALTGLKKASFNQTLHLMKRSNRSLVQLFACTKYANWQSASLWASILPRTVWPRASTLQSGEPAG